MITSQKIKTVDHISNLVADAKEEGKKIVHCHGEFDLLHIGHTRYFKAAKEFGDVLVVTLTPDRFVAKGPGRPVFNQDLRAEAIANLEFVDYVGINEWATAEETLRLIKPDVYVKGSEYVKKKDVTGRLDKERKLIESLGGKMQFTHEVIFSSSKLLNNNFNVFTQDTKPFLRTMATQYKALDIIGLLEKLNDLKILVIGEWRVDTHCICSSAKKGLPYKVKEKFYSATGALTGINVLSAYCGAVDFISFSGSVPVDKLVLPENIRMVHDMQDEQSSHDVAITHYWDEKTVYHLFSVSDKQGGDNALGKEEALLCHIDEKLKEYNAVLVFDQGQGRVTKKIAQFLSQNARHLSVACTGNGPFFGRAEKFYNIDYLALDENQSPRNCMEEFPISCFRNDTKDMTITWDAGGTLYCNRMETQELAEFVEPENLVSYQDETSALFAMLAPLKSLQVERHCSWLLGNAVATMVRGMKPGCWKFDRLLFDKFIISLLNC